MRKHPLLQIRGRSGFSMIELALTLVVIAIMAAMISPRFIRIMQSTKVARSSAVVAGDLEQAFTLAGRYRKPMRITCDCANATYTIADRSDGTVRLTRRLQDDDLGTMTLTWEWPNGANQRVDVFPNGVATDLLRLRITSGTSTRAITMSSAGIVRIIP
jgi:prepilin-type N-terminal cleavage/methylation domain-containing protein